MTRPTRPKLRACVMMLLLVLICIAAASVRHWLEKVVEKAMAADQPIAKPNSDVSRTASRASRPGLPATQPGKELSLEQLKAARERVMPLQRKLERPGPHDWLARHHEPGQTFEQYLRCQPVTPRGRRNVIYIQPLGQFTETQRKVVALTAEFTGLYFCVPVTVQQDLPLSIIPASARRTHPTWGDKQILSTYVLDHVLRPRLPKDAAAFIAFTASDLWPGEGWNFVFGQASLSERVGVWSIYRNGEPDRSQADFRLCLLRTMKTAVHEIGHMFSMQHCIAYQCGMCGSNSRAEADARPIALCAECAPKLWWATGCDPVQRYRGLAEFCRAQGLKAELTLYEKLADALTAVAKPK